MLTPCKMHEQKSNRHINNCLNVKLRPLNHWSGMVSGSLEALHTADLERLSSKVCGTGKCCLEFSQAYASVRRQGWRTLWTFYMTDVAFLFCDRSLASKQLLFLRSTAYAVSAHMLSQFRPSVRRSVTRVDQSKTVEVRIMQFSPYSSPIPLLFAR